MDSRAPVGVSVVVPSFNQGHFIDETIKSLLNQKYPALELLVVDGGSTDDTVQRLEAYGDQIRWISEPDDGQTDAIIKGFARTTQPWITWLNSDDVQTERALWHVAEAVAACPEAEVLIGRGHYMEADGSGLRPYPTVGVGPNVDMVTEFFDKGYVAQPSVFYRRALYERVGGLNRSLRYCMDYELWSKFATNKATFAYIDADISGNRWYKTTKTAANTLDLYAEVIATQHRLFGAASPFFVQAVSDHFYAKFHSPFYGDRHHIAIRWLYFKLFWFLLNIRSPWYWAKGCFTQTISKSGPIIGDKLKMTDFLTAGWCAIRERK